MSTASVSCCLSVLGQDVFALTPSLLSGWRGCDFPVLTATPLAFQAGSEYKLYRPPAGLLPPKQDPRVWAQNEEAFWLLLPPLSLGEGHIPIIVKHLSP